MDTMEGAGFFSLIITKTIDSTAVYAAIVKLSSASTLILWLLVIFFGFRVFQEALKSLTAKAAVAEAVMSMNKTVIMYLAYTTAGLMIFGFIFTINELFEIFGSVNMINNKILDLRSTLIHSEKNYDDFIHGLLSYTADIGNIVTTPFIWLLYQLTSLAYVFINQLSDFLFAVGMGLIYVFGFVAIGTSSLSGPWNIFEGWTKNILFLFIWAAIEPILLGFVYVMMVPATNFLAHTYNGGMGIKGIAVWYLFTTIILFVVALLKIMSPFLAYMIASNNSIGSVLGAGAAVPATVIMNNIMAKMAGENSAARQIYSGMMPNDEDTRKRDIASQKVGDFMNSNIGDVGRKIKSGLSGFSFGSSSPGDTSTTNTGPANAGEASSASDKINSNSSSGGDGSQGNNGSSQERSSSTTSEASNAGDKISSGSSNSGEGPHSRTGSTQEGSNSTNTMDSNTGDKIKSGLGGVSSGDSGSHSGSNSTQDESSTSTGGDDAGRKIKSGLSGLSSGDDGPQDSNDELPDKE